MPDSTPEYFAPFFSVMVPGRPWIIVLVPLSPSVYPCLPCLLTVKLASRYIIRSLRCLIGVAVSPVVLAEGLGVFAAPLVGVEFDGRWVIGFADPWDHALGAGGFLGTERRSALRLM